MFARTALALPVAALAMTAVSCAPFSDAATRLASDINGAASRLGPDEGARFTLVHETPSMAGQCEGTYRVQLDAVGAIIIWCHDGAGRVASSHSTSSHRPSVDTARSFILDKSARAPLRILLERRRGRAVIVAVT